MPRKWAESETAKLLNIASRHHTNHLEGYRWTDISQELNDVYHNDRTPKACAIKFYHLHGDDFGFIKH